MHGPLPLCTGPRDRGFSLPGIVITLTLTSLILCALGILAGALFQSGGNTTAQFTGEDYPLAPNYSAFQNAIQLHFAFHAACDQSDAIYVYGGRKTHPLFDPTGPSQVLPLTFSVQAALTTNGSGALSLQSGWESKSTYAELASQFIGPGSAADFTVLTIQGHSRVSSITQQRRYVQTISGHPVCLYRVSHQSIDWSTGIPAAGPTLSYRIAYEQNADNWAIPPGAEHRWYRSDASWQRIQEAPARVTFADPSALGGDAQSSLLHSGSRFDYFLACIR